MIFSLLAFIVVAAPIKPNPKLTPGVADPTATLEKICTPGYTAKVRNVSALVKKQVFAEYGINPTSDKFEVDHLISLELGGSNDIKNLWPQSYTTQPLNARRKDVLENKLHNMICSKQITIKQAQKAISTDWIKAYNKFIF